MYRNGLRNSLRDLWGFTKANFYKRTLPTITASWPIIIAALCAADRFSLGLRFKNYSQWNIANVSPFRVILIQKLYTKFIPTDFPSGQSSNLYPYSYTRITNEIYFIIIVFAYRS